MENKRKKTVQTGQSKKRKLDPLVDWGEAKDNIDVLEEIPSSWFIFSLEEGDQTTPRGLDWRQKPDIQVGKKLKHFSRILETGA